MLSISSPALLHFFQETFGLLPFSLWTCPAFLPSARTTESLPLLLWWLKPSFAVFVDLFLVGRRPSFHFSCSLWLLLPSSSCRSPGEFPLAFLSIVQHDLDSPRRSSLDWVWMAVAWPWAALSLFACVHHDLPSFIGNQCSDLTLCGLWVYCLQDGAEETTVEKERRMTLFNTFAATPGARNLAVDVEFDPLPFAAGVSCGSLQISLYGCVFAFQFNSFGPCLYCLPRRLLQGISFWISSQSAFLGSRAVIFYLGDL